MWMQLSQNWYSMSCGGHLPAVAWSAKMIMMMKCISKGFSGHHHLCLKTAASMEIRIEPVLPASKLVQQVGVARTGPEPTPIPICCVGWLGFDPSWHPYLFLGSGHPRSDLSLHPYLFHGWGQ